MTAVITIALPFFAIIAAGFIAGRRRVMQPEDAGALNRFVFNFAMPAALFGLTARADALSGEQLTLAGIYGVAGLCALFGAYGLARMVFKLDGQSAGAHAFASTLGNAVFLGLPIALSIPGWGESFVVLMLIEGTLVIGIAATMMRPKQAGGLAAKLIGPLKNPLVASMLGGLAFALIARPAGVEFSGPIARFCEILGRAAGPAALFSLGLFLATTKAPALDAVGGRVGAIVAIKMVLLPTMTLGLLSLAGLTAPTLFGPAALFTLVPTGVGAFVMASQIGRYETEAASAVTVTTALSLVTISAVLAIFA